MEAGGGICRLMLGGDVDEPDAATGERFTAERAATAFCCWMADRSDCCGDTGMATGGVMDGDERPCVGDVAEDSERTRCGGAKHPLPMVGWGCPAAAAAALAAVGTGRGGDTCDDGTAKRGPPVGPLTEPAELRAGVLVPEPDAELLALPCTRKAPCSMALACRAASAAAATAAAEFCGSDGVRAREIATATELSARRVGDACTTERGAATPLFPLPLPPLSGGTEPARTGSAVAYVESGSDMAGTVDTDDAVDSASGVNGGVWFGRPYGTEAVRYGDDETEVDVADIDDDDDEWVG